MPAPTPGLFGRFGTAGRLEKQWKQTDRFKSAIEGAESSLKHLYGEEAKGSEAQKKRHAEVAAAIQKVSKALEGTTQNAKKYGKAVERDTKLVLEFAKKHKLSLDEAVEMYEKVGRKQTMFNKGLGWGLDKLKRWGSAAATFGAAMKEYRKRIDEVRTGHQLLLADTALTAGGTGNAFKDTQKYIDGYRDAVRSAHTMTAKWGVSADEARQTTKALAFSLRGQIKDIGKLGQVLKEDTDRIYGFAKAMNVDAATALTFFRNQMRVQGKTHDQARKSLDTVIAGYDQMRVRVGDAAAPLKEEYLATLQQIRQELGPTQVSTGAMTAAMNMLAESAKKAGLSAKGITDTMAAAPKLLKGLPRFYKQQIGGGILSAMSANTKQFQALAKQHPKIAKQLQTLAKTKMPIWEKRELAMQLTEGTALGMAGVLKKLKQVGPALRTQYYKNMGLTAQQIVAIESGLKTGELSAKKLGELTKGVQKGQKDATKTRETMHESLKQNTKGLDNMVIRTQELENRIRGLIDQYSTYVTPALGALTMALNIRNLSSSLSSAFAGSSGRIGSALGKASGPLMAGFIGFEVGKAVGNAILKADEAKEKKESKTEAKAVGKEVGALKARHARQLKGLSGKERLAALYAQNQATKKLLKHLWVERGLSGKEIEKEAPGLRAYAKKLRTEMFAESKKLHQAGVKVKVADLKKMAPKAAEIRTMQQEIAKNLPSSGTFLGQMTRTMMRMTGMTKGTAGVVLNPMAKQEKLRAEAEKRAKVGEAALKSTTPQRRATVGPPTAKEAQTPTTAPQSKTPGTEAGGSQSNYDPAMNEYTVQTTTKISGNDPNFQSLMQQNQSVFNPKRGR